MANVSKSITVNLTSGEVFEVLSTSVKSLSGIDGAVVLGIDVNGQSLRYINSDDNISGGAGLLALLGTFVTIPTSATENVYIPADDISMVVPSGAAGSAGIVLWNDSIGSSLVSTSSTATVAAIKVLINAL